MQSPRSRVGSELTRPVSNKRRRSDRKFIVKKVIRPKRTVRSLTRPVHGYDYVPTGENRRRFITGRGR